MKILKKTIFSPFYAYHAYDKVKKLEKKIYNQVSLKAIKEFSTMDFYKNLFIINNNSGLNLSEERDKKITVSLTSYSYRVKDVYLTIESLLNQSVKPDRIILWLSSSEYSINTIPATLKKQMNRGLEVKFCEDIKSYKKLIPTLKECSKDIIITTDDDIMYPIDFIDGLYSAYLNNSNNVYCYRARELPKDRTKILDYKNWDNTKSTEASINIVPIGIGGVLYTADKFDDNILNQEFFMSLAPKADDIWFKAMTMLKNTNCQLVEYHRDFFTNFVEIPNTQEIALSNTNMVKNGNNPQIKAVFEKFKLI